MSSEDCAKHCFKNELTLETFHSFLKFISYLQILKKYLNAGDSIVLGVGHDIDTRIFKMLHQLFAWKILEKNRKIAAVTIDKLISKIS